MSHDHPHGKHKKNNFVTEEQLLNELSGSAMEFIPEALPKDTVETMAMLDEALAEAAMAETQDRSAAASKVFELLFDGEYDAITTEAVLKQLAAAISTTQKVTKDGYREYRKRNAPLQPVLDASNSYVVHAGSICRQVFDRQAGTLTPQPLCSFEARIIASILHDDGVEQTRHYTLEGSTMHGEPLAPVTILASRFEAMTWVSEAWGESAVIYAGPGVKDHLRAAIQLLSSPERITVYGHSGWRSIDGQWVYLHKTGAVGAQGETTNVTVELPGELQRIDLPAPPDREAAAEALRMSLDLFAVAPDRIMAPLIAALYRAALGDADFGVSITGETGARKTQVAILLQQHFGAGFSARSLSSWISTGNYLEAYLYYAKDAVVVVDDFNPTGSKHDIDKFHALAERVFRAVGNQSGRGRMNADATLAPVRAPRALVISTGEDIPKGQSLKARMLILPISRGSKSKPADVDLHALTTAQKAGSSGMYAMAMAAFIHWLASDYEAHRARFTELHHTERDKLLELDIHGRTVDIASQLLATWTMLGAFAESINAYSKDDLTMLLERARTGILEPLAQQAEHQADSDPTARFFELVHSLISGGRAHLAAPDGKCPGEGYGWDINYDSEGEFLFANPKGFCIGRVGAHLDEIWLDPQMVYAQVQELARTQNDPLPLTQSTLWSNLAGQNLILQTIEGRAKTVRNTHKRAIEGRKPRVLVVPLDVFMMGTVPGSETDGDPEKRPATPSGAHSTSQSPKSPQKNTHPPIHNDDFADTPDGQGLDDEVEV